MSKRLRWQLLTLLLALCLAIPAGVAGHKWRLFELAWFKVREWSSAGRWQSTSRWLPDYRVEIEALPIKGLNNVSALTFDPDRRSLFAVTNKNAELIELSLSGSVLRRIPLSGFDDTEAVEYISPGIYVISDERSQRLFRVHVDERTRWLDAAESQQLELVLGPHDNNGVEGLAYDAAGQRLFIAKERKPMQILQVRGFPPPGDGAPVEVSVVSGSRQDRQLFVRDLSALQFDPIHQHLLALSDESRLVLELSLDGQPISSLLLWPGLHGLQRSVPQPEGLAMDDQGLLYLVSEPNLFYRFRQVAPP